MGVNNDDGIEIITQEEWGRARRMGYGKIWDGRRYILNKATNVWREVEVNAPRIERKRREW